VYGRKRKEAYRTGVFLWLSAITCNGTDKNYVIFIRNVINIKGDTYGG